MADIELTMKISEEIYNRYMNYTENYVDFMFFGTEEKIVRAIRNGVILPKGHGDLIDRSQILTVTDFMEDGTERCYVPYEHIEEAEPIIEAEKGREK